MEGETATAERVDEEWDAAQGRMAHAVDVAAGESRKKAHPRVLVLAR